MREHPIIFSVPMVQAILDGTKTQTRRVLKRPYENGNWSVKPTIAHRFNGHTHDWYLNDAPEPVGAIKCPYGQVGDQLWVRETWGVVSHFLNDNGEMINWIPDRPSKPINEMPFGNGYYSGHAIYRADGEFEWAGEDGDDEGKSMWKSSIHMPRMASRILLEITDIRIERLNDISEEDAKAEGVTDSFPARECNSDKPFCEGYMHLWKSINGVNSWYENSWVWVVEFKVIQNNASVK